jgi:hypothetical protein
MNNRNTTDQKLTLEEKGLIIKMGKCGGKGTNLYEEAINDQVLYRGS